ncbi:helix-turn-helix domain-containing protein [Lacimicrobium alkaliphilum]|uniref:HTH araC/xylS-type domain-containing protein n=1 Tax=Lacimicrobium alkaliphilum TaxID=1526571 RepID=A0A0U2PEH1_9ALTE|nr:helix-turn-helix domain-containing protein [Lacimicrobium alkaliphilum]ALS97597.1 hypothetical protein AT746_04475 [Lacimicrobium alkaliphilum]
MSQQQVFKDRFLSLQTLAEQAKVSRHTLSQYLNEVEGCHFYDFVNRHRVQEAKEQLQHSASTILDIALEAGFNNKATFNSAFRKHTGMTPSQYRQQQ